MSDDGDEQAKHAAVFAIASKSMMRICDEMLKAAPPGQDQLDVASVVLGAGIKCLVATIGVASAINYLRNLALGLEGSTRKTDLN